MATLVSFLVQKIPPFSFYRTRIWSLRSGRKNSPGGNMRIFFAIICGLNISSVCNATPIEFVYTGSSTKNPGFVIVARGDTGNRQLMANGGYSIEHDSAEITLGEITLGETYRFTSPTRTFLNQNAKSVGFARAEGDMTDLFDLIGGSHLDALVSWDMLSSIAKQSGVGMLLQWGDFPTRNTPVMTDHGRLLFQFDNQVQMTFEARLIPEPTSLMIVVGSLLLFFRR